MSIADVQVEAPAQPDAFPVPDKIAWPKAKLTFKRAMLESSFHFMIWASMARRPKLTTWDLTWFPTYMCNLKCWYCNSIYGKAEPAEPDKAVKRIIELAPSSISILGGEPFIVKGMVGYIRQLREALPNAFIMVTTNGMVKSDQIAEAMPMLDSLCVSIDGEGKFQKGPRGGDSDVIINNIRVAHEARVKCGRKIDLVVNTVVSKYNALHLPGFFRKIATEISPDILAFAQGLMPFDGPHSIGSSPEVAREFTHQMNELKKEMRVLVVGQLANDQTRDQDLHVVDEQKVETRIGGAPTFRCHQERFYAHITPGGKTFTCATYAGINGVRDSVLREWSKRNIGNAMKLWWNGFYRWVIKPPSFNCTEFRGCPEWTEDIMKCKTDSELPIEIDRIRGRLTEKHVRDSVRFIRKYVNPEFDADLLRAPK